MKKIIHPWSNHEGYNCFGCSPDNPIGLHLEFYEDGDYIVSTWHPETEVWETCTPYFDRRNIHFYINRLGFHAVEFFNEHHPDPHMPEQFDQEDGLFKFEKRMK